MQPAVLPKFSNEILLQQAVAALLARMPNIRDVQILQGILELGKDIVFTTVGPLGESLHCAAVIKNVPLSGKVGASGGLRATFDQIEQCLDTPFLDTRGETKRIHSVYVISPFEMSQISIASIAGKVKSRFGQITFLTGAELFRLFQKYWPDFLLHEASALERFSTEIDKSAGDSAALSILAFDYNLGVVEQIFPSIYAKPTFERTLRSFGLGRAEEYFSDEISWTKSSIEHAKNSSVVLLKSIKNILDWPFPDNDISQKISSLNLLTLIERHAKELQDIILTAHKEKTKQERTKIDQIPKDVKITLPKHLIKRLISENEMVLSEINRGFGFIKSEFNNNDKNIEYFKDNDKNLMENINFRKSCLIDDCFHAEPEGIIRAISSRTFDLGSKIVDNYCGDLLIVGGPGTGKTTFCRRGALADAERFSSGASDILPVYIALHRLAKIKIVDFETTFLNVNSQSALLPTIDYANKSHRIRFYLDGLDEVSSDVQRGELLKLANSDSGRPSNCQIIITARDYIYDRRFDKIPRIKLSGLNEEGLFHLSLGWFDGCAQTATTFINLVKESAIYGLLRVPLLATVALLIYKRTRRIPENRCQLYSAFVSLLCGGWDAAKGTVRTTHFGIVTKQVVLNSLANELHEKRIREFDMNFFERSVHRSLGKQISNNTDLLLEEILRDGIITRSGAIFHFCHHSIQEFLTAKYKNGDPNKVGSIACLRKFLAGDDWWREVLSFFIGLSDNPDAMNRWLDSNGWRNSGRIDSDDYDSAGTQSQFLHRVLKDNFPQYSNK